jgi:hypothetical protein
MQYRGRTHSGSSSPCQFWRLERNGRTMGEARRRHEEARLEQRIVSGAPVSGCFRTTPVAVRSRYSWPVAEGAAAGITTPLALYRDASVIAYRFPPQSAMSRRQSRRRIPSTRSSCADGDRVKRVDLAYGADSVAFVQYSFNSHRRSRGDHRAQGGGRGGSSAAQVQASDDVGLPNGRRNTAWWSA